MERQRLMFVWSKEAHVWQRTHAMLNADADHYMGAHNIVANANMYKQNIYLYSFMATKIVERMFRWNAVEHLMSSMNYSK